MIIFYFKFIFNFFLLNLSLVYFLLEEILSSTIHRCTDPHLMEPRVVEIICETV
jgi:vacuolar protein sorting-associated protein 51